MRMINRLFDTVMDGSLFGTIGDTPEVKKAGMTMDALVLTTIPKEKQREALEVIAKWDRAVKEQAFEIGFKCAMALFTNAEIKMEDL